jgi:hypothetical protein
MASTTGRLRRIEAKTGQRSMSLAMVNPVGEVWTKGARISG